MFFRLSFLCVWALALASPARGQQPDSAALGSAKARIRDCYRVVTKDSIVFFYSDTYALTPPGCATLRRHVHFDSTGTFRGYVRDYRLKNNALALSGAYREGKKEGLFELYHPTGELAARGNYRAGQQVGDWGYWYPSGQRRQVLSFGAGGPPLVQQFWDEKGQQLVRDGNGTWYRDEDQLRWGGAVLNGIPNGRWQLRRLDGSSQLVAVENYAKGHFRNGRFVEEDEVYFDESRVSLVDWEDYSTAEKLVLGPPCPPVKKP